MRIAVAGGGLAGLTCAKRLIEGGHSVIVLEGLPMLGGRASTWIDADGDVVEQGLHLFLGAYSELRALLRELERPPDQVLAWTTRIRFQDTDGPVEALFSIDPLRAPGATVASALANNDYLGPLHKLALVPIAAPAIRGYEHLRETWDRRTVVDLWERAGGDELVMRRFLDPLCRALQFTGPAQFSAFDFLAWIRQIVAHPADVHVAGYRGPRHETIFEPFGRWLAARGAEVRTACPVDRLRVEPTARGMRANGLVLRTGEEVDADLVVLAVPAWEVAPILPPELRSMPFFASIEQLPVAPALSVQLWFDGDRISSKEYTLVAGSRVAAYQDQSTTAYPDPRGSRVSAIVSPADTLLEAPHDAIVAEVLEALRAVEPGVRGRDPFKAVVIKHRKHLVRPTPLALSRRPTQVTPVPNLFLAGDWTQQEHLGNQEGAVRGGNRCADAILAAFG